MSTGRYARSCESAHARAVTSVPVAHNTLLSQSPQRTRNLTPMRDMARRHSSDELRTLSLEMTVSASSFS